MTSAVAEKPGLARDIARVLGARKKAQVFSDKYSHQGQTRMDDKAEAERLHRALSPHGSGTVRKIEKKIRRNRPSPLYGLTSLQRDANRRFGFTAVQVLERARAL